MGAEAKTEHIPIEKKTNPRRYTLPKNPLKVHNNQKLWFYDGTARRVFNLNARVATVANPIESRHKWRLLPKLAVEIRMGIKRDQGMLLYHSMALSTLEVPPGIGH